MFRSKFGNFITIKAIAGVFQMCEGVEAAVNAVRADGSGLSVGKKYCVFFKKYLVQVGLTAGVVGVGAVRD